MGSLGSLGMIFGWMINPHMIPNPGARTWRLKDSAGNWNAIAASSKYGLGLFATGAPLKLFESISSNSDSYQRPKHLQDGSDQYWNSLLRNPISGSGTGIGSPSVWSVGILMSKPWRSWAFGEEDKARSGSKRKVPVAAALGNGHDGDPPDSSNRRYPTRTLTTILLGLNVLVYLGQIATKGRILLWGAKINALIDQGQFWRLLTPSVLHANVFHLLVNSYSLNSIGPTVESLAGPKRFLAVYSTSALASSSLSYFCSAAPSVGASGAIFGLVGALAVFLVRHKNMMVGGQQSLQEVARVIVANMALGLLSGGIDNWSHLGGLIGGAAVTWLLGPVYTFELRPGEGQRQLVDRPPIFYLLPPRTRKKR